MAKREYEYFALEGMGETREHPSGLVRKVETPDGFYVERYSKISRKWEYEFEAFKYFCGRDQVLWRLQRCSCHPASRLS